MSVSTTKVCRSSIAAPRAGQPGLRLAALSLAGHPDPRRFVAEFSGNERTVADYLLAEVLARQPADVRRCSFGPRSSTTSRGRWRTTSSAPPGPNASFSRSRTRTLRRRGRCGEDDVPLPPAAGRSPAAGAPPHEPRGRAPTSPRRRRVVRRPWQRARGGPPRRASRGVGLRRPPPRRARPHALARRAGSRGRPAPRGPAGGCSTRARARGVHGLPGALRPFARDGGVVHRAGGAAWRGRSARPAGTFRAQPRHRPARPRAPSRRRRVRARRGPHAPRAGSQRFDGCSSGTTRARRP